MPATSTEALWEELDHIERQDRALHARRLEVLGELEARWIDDPCVPQLETEVAARYRKSNYSASEEVRTAVALRDLPALREATSQGELSRDQLRWVTRFATPETDRQWAERAPRMTPNQLKLEWERQVRRTREQAEDDHAILVP